MLQTMPQDGQSVGVSLQTSTKQYNNVQKTGGFGKIFTKSIISTDSKQIEIKSFGCQENGIQEFEIPASMIGTQGITLEVPTTMATSGNDRKH